MEALLFLCALIAIGIIVIWAILNDESPKANAKSAQLLQRLSRHAPNSPDTLPPKPR